MKKQNMYLYAWKLDMFEKHIKVSIDDKGFIHEIDGEKIDAIPIEDYGDFLLVDVPIDNAFEVWCSKTQ